MIENRPRLAAKALLHLVLIGMATASAAPASASLRYSVQLEDLRSAELEVRLEIRGIPTDSPYSLRSVPAYMANPVAAPVANPVLGIRATGLETGRELEIEETQTPAGAVFRIAKPEASLRVDYTVSIAFQESRQTRDYPIRLPFMDARRALLYGNYIFMFPDSEEEPAIAVGRPANIQVEFLYPKHAPLWGTPDVARLHSLYQLMSLQFGFGDFEREHFKASGVSVTLVTFDGEFDALERAAIKATAGKAFEEVVGLFGSAPFPDFSLLIYRSSGIGGMEGSFSCQVYVNENLNVADASSKAVRSFYSVILHEIFHSWNPISIYAVHDPWIKEGVTGYYGEVLSARSDLLLDQDLRDSFGYYAKQLTHNSLFGAIGLTDSRIWHNEYSSENWRTLTYERGRAVALLLDVAIRERTGNRSSLDDVLRALYRRFRDRSYTHAQLLDCIRSVTRQDFSDFFQDYISGTKLASSAEIEAARKKAFELGILRNSTTESELAPH